jgi:two-component system OmpR family sensor kinase
MSLRARLLLVLGVLLLVYAVAAVLIVSAQRDLLIEQVDERLQSVSPSDIAGLMGRADSGALGGPTAQSPFSELYIAMIRSDGAIASLLVGALPGVPDVGEAVRATGGRGITTVGSAEGDGRYRALVLSEPRSGDLRVVAQPLTELDAALAGLSRTLWIVGGIIAVGLGVAFFWIERLGLRPIARVTATADAIAAGDRARRVEVADDQTEAGKLGHAFNVMLDERDAAENRLRQFVADAAHELRTPLTSVRGYLQLDEQGAFRDPGELEDVVRRLSAEATRMHGLVEDLLVLASLDEERPLHITDIDLGRLLRDAAQDAQAVQPERPIDVRLPDRGPEARGDEALLIQLVGILVANALAHTPVTASVTLTAARDGDAVAVTVADRGPGLAPEVAAHVFDRFWRGETGRSRAAGGSAGLGLAIARSIAEIHGGTIALETAPGAGCAFTVRLPAA